MAEEKSMKRGKVYIAGAGPGDPALLTVKTAELLRTADVIVYDRLVDRSLLEAASAKARKVYVGKKVGEGLLQNRINLLMVSEASRGRVVLRLKGGDPMIFGRGGEEAEFLRHHRVPFEVIPGVTSALAAPAMAGIPLTQRGVSSSILIATGSEARSKGGSRIPWRDLPGIADTVVILMAARSFRRIARELVLGGLKSETPVAVVRWATTEKQQTLLSSLGAIIKDAKGAVVKPPCVIVVGDVCLLARELDWFKVGGKSTLEIGEDARTHIRQ